jgi:GTP-binding protein
MDTPEGAMDAETQKIASALFRAPCDFVIGAVSMDLIPASDLPEVAFIGRSNVGKSSLINALTGRKTLARTSNTPGRTQQLNFFNLGGRMMLVDLPGYGYAKVSRKEVKIWTQLIRDYLRGRQQLARVLVLVDSRHGLKPSDLEMMEMLDNHAVSYQLVLTKRDKIKQTDCDSVLASIQSRFNDHPALHPQVLVTSSEKGDGIARLHHELYQLL